MAKALGTAKTIARVHHSSYFSNRGLNYEKHLQIDRLICPEYSTAQAIASTEADSKKIRRVRRPLTGTRCKIIGQGAIFDQKVDRYRQLSRERWSRLGALLEIAKTGGAGDLARAVEEEKYVEFEGRFRGHEQEIEERLAPYL